MHPLFFLYPASRERGPIKETPSLHFFLYLWRGFNKGIKKHHPRENK